MPILLASIDTLSPELLGYIFTIFFEDEPACGQWDRLEGGYTNFYGMETRKIKLQQVCKRWRDVLVQTPALWTIGCFSTLQSEDERRIISDHIQQRSGNLSLTVAFCYDSKEGKEEERDGHYSMWREYTQSVIYRLSEVEIFYNLPELYRSGTSQTVPILKSLETSKYLTKLQLKWIGSDLLYPSSFEKKITLGFPFLQILVVHITSFPTSLTIKAPKLRVLEMEHCSITSCRLYILMSEASSQLEEISIGQGTCYGSMCDMDQLRFPRLTKLKLRFSVFSRKCSVSSRKCFIDPRLFLLKTCQRSSLSPLPPPQMELFKLRKVFFDITSMKFMCAVPPEIFWHTNILGLSIEFRPKSSYRVRKFARTMLKWIENAPDLVKCHLNFFILTDLRNGSRRNLILDPILLSFISMPTRCPDPTQDSRTNNDDEAANGKTLCSNLSGLFIAEGEIHFPGLLRQLVVERKMAVKREPFTFEAELVQDIVLLYGCVSIKGVKRKFVKERGCWDNLGSLMMFNKGLGDDEGRLGSESDESDMDGGDLALLEDEGGILGNIFEIEDRYERVEVLCDLLEDEGAFECESDDSGSEIF